MKIQGYNPGTAIRWLDETTEGFRTGIVRARYYDPDITEIDGETIEIKVIGNSPVDKIKESCSENMIIIDHTKVTLRHSSE